MVLEFNIKIENNTLNILVVLLNLGCMREVKANLSSVLDPNVGDTEGVYSPVKIESVLRLAKRQPLSKSRFIYLDYLHKAQKKIIRKRKGIDLGQKSFEELSRV